MLRRSTNSKPEIFLCAMAASANMMETCIPAQKRWKSPALKILMRFHSTLVDERLCGTNGPTAEKDVLTESQWLLQVHIPHQLGEIYA
jgi:hypothetical protein